MQLVIVAHDGYAETPTAQGAIDPARVVEFGKPGNKKRQKE
jgi:hypothetical protein